MSLSQAIDSEKTYSFSFLNLVTWTNVWVGKYFHYRNSDTSIYFQTLVNIVKVFLQCFENEVTEKFSGNFSYAQRNKELKLNI